MVFNQVMTWGGGGRHSTAVAFSLGTQPGTGLNQAAGIIEPRGKKGVFSENLPS